MSSKKIGCLTILLAIAVIWGIWHFIGHADVDTTAKSGHFFYRMTVAVETPEGIKTGSAVRRIGFYTEPRLGDEGGKGYGLTRGQAVIVDLGQRGILFALIDGWGRSDYGSEIILNMFPLRENTKVGISVTLKPDDYPFLVHFQNLNDPKSVEMIIPEGMSKKQEGVSIESAFGTGVRIRQVSLEIVDEQPTTKGILATLPWLSDVRRSYLSGKHVVTTNMLYDWMGGNDFIVGDD